MKFEFQTEFSSLSPNLFTGGLGFFYAAVTHA